MVETSEAVEATEVAALVTEAEVDNLEVVVIREEEVLHSAAAEEVEIEAEVEEEDKEEVAEEETQMPLFSSETWLTHAPIES